MRIILLESSHASQSSEGTRELVTVENTEISNSPWELSVRTLSVAESETVTGAVHWLETEILLLNLNLEHVLRVVLPMAGSLPQIDVVHVWSNDLFVSTGPVLLTQKLEKGVVDFGTVWQEEARSGGELVEEEEFLLLTNLSVITLGSLLQVLLVLFQLLLVWERDTVDTLEGIVVGVSEEVGRGVLY